MDFGKIENPDSVDLRLPPDHPMTKAVLSGDLSAKPSLYVGCPVWRNKGWAGTLYPSDAKEKDFLQHYVRQFNTIELNMTHYRIPDQKMIRQWRQACDGQQFHFCPKILQTISHKQIMEGTARPLVQAFCKALKPLSDYLGCCFIQMPPSFAPCHLPRLLSCLDDFLLAAMPLAVEVRHAAWFEGDNYRILAAALQERGVTTVMTDVAGRRDVLHMCLTTPVAMIRFVGNGLHQTDYSRIDEWVLRIGSWSQQGLHSLYFFVHEPDNILSPQLSAYLIQQLNTHCELSLRAPVLSNSAPEMVQGSLF